MALQPSKPMAALLATLAALALPAFAQAGAVRPLVTSTIDDRDTVALAGNTRSEAAPENDRGRVADAFPLAHMQLLLRRPAETEAALEARIDALTERGSPSFHQWLTNAEFAAYAPATSDQSAVRGWLTSHHFTVNSVGNGGLVIDFSGTAGAVREAFHTEIHHLVVDGASHIANMSDPRIPAALAPVVNGIVSLHDFRPHAYYKPKSAYTFTNSSGDTYEAVVPGDLATIYNLNPLFSEGITGKGQTIVVIEDTDVYSTADWSAFRSAFGLSGYTSGSFTQVHPLPGNGGSNCTDPGVVSGNEVEAELDAEWASAGAPNAAIVLASCSDTTTTFGGLIALQNLLASATPPTIVSISYGECETENGATANAAYSSAYEQAVALGTSVFVAAGDSGGASCDQNKAAATHGIVVSGFASTPYNVAVGGTDFGDFYAGTVSSYWSTTNSATYASALSYVPEIPWNDSCAGSLLATFEGYSKSAGATGFCNRGAGAADFRTTAAGSGGPSGCATGAPATRGVVGGTCAGWPKPSWQALVGNPSDSVRDLPDVSLFAANGLWGHYYVICDSDAADGGVPCTGAPSGWPGAGGTSFASPIWASFQALVNEYTGSKQGNPNPAYYRIATAEYGASGNAACSSTLGNQVGSQCAFYDVTLGDNDVNCTGTVDCYLPSGKDGVLSKKVKLDEPAFKTGTGWDFATGIGTVNVFNLVKTY
jgi:subtilase family serine protease